MSGRFGISYQEWKKGDLPHDPAVSIVLNEWSTINGLITISMSLASDTEIDFAIDQLKADLEVARKKAKSRIKYQREKIRNSIGK